MFSFKSIPVFSDFATYTKKKTVSLYHLMLVLKIILPLPTKKNYIIAFSEGFYKAVEPQTLSIFTLLIHNQINGSTHQQKKLEKTLKVINLSPLVLVFHEIYTIS